MSMSAINDKHSSNKNKLCSASEVLYLLPRYGGCVMDQQLVPHRPHYVQHRDPTTVNKHSDISLCESVKKVHSNKQYGNCYKGS